MSSIIKKQLRQGVTLGIIPSDRAKTDTLLISLALPVDEDVTKYALLSRVLNCGTESYPSLLEINRRRRQLYNATVSSSISRIGETTLLNFSFVSMKQKYAYDDVDIFGGALDLVSEMIFHPYLKDGKLKEEYIATEKRMLADALRAKINDKISYTLNRGTTLMCEGEPYAIPAGGRLEDIDAITADELLAVFKKIRETGTVTMLYAGELDEKEITDRLSALPFEARPDLTKPATPKKQRDEVNYVTETLDIAQAKLMIGFKTGVTLRDSDSATMTVFNEVFGGSPTSKLFMNVREKMSLCYFCMSMADAHKDVLRVLSGIEAANYEKARDGILAELDAIRRGEITDAELTAAKLSVKNRYTELTDSPSSLCTWYLSRFAAGRDDSPEEAIAQIEAVTVKDIAELASHISTDTVYLLKGAEQ